MAQPTTSGRHIGQGIAPCARMTPHTYHNAPPRTPRFRRLELVPYRWYPHRVLPDDARAPDADPAAPTPSDRSLHELDGMVVNIELTVISIVQGMALSFLVEGARALFVEGRPSSLPYLLSGLLVAFSLWARAVVHAFTVVRWPLELGHNFAYFLAALCEAALFTQAGNPQRWYAICVVMVLLFWAMFVYERRMYRLRRGDGGGPQALALIDTLEAEHEHNIRVFMPALLVTWGGFAALAYGRPDVFFEGGWHVALGALQTLGLLGYLAHVIRFYLRVTGPIVAARAEWERRAA